ncbi:MAG: DUF5715 family protein [Bacteroidales bacterium]|nr:DUF5715 family protein [Bacteroidales bacterium]MDD4362066.1 DUF5715 family protein [Bacteroidales bacterium]
MIALARSLGNNDKKEAKLSKNTTFYKLGQCPDCKVISTRHWKVGKLRDNNDLHLVSGRLMGIEPFASNAEMEEKLPGLLRRRKLKALKEEADTYRLKNLTHSEPYLVPKAVDLLEEIGERFHDKLKELNLPSYYLMVSSVLRTNESQQGLGKRNVNATKNESSHIYGTSFDISYKEFLPKHEKPAPEGFCRHDMMRHPLAEVLTEMSNEGRCLVVKEVKQACFHITVLE